jgi:hypothetical protein
MKIEKVILSGTFCFPYGDAAGERIKHLAKGFTDNLNQVSVISLYGMPIDGAYKSGCLTVNRNKIEYQAILNATKQRLTSNYFLRLYYRIKFLIFIPRLIKSTLNSLNGSESELLFLYGRSYFFLNGILNGIVKRNYKTRVIFDVVEPPRLQTGLKEFILHPFVLDSYLVFKKLLFKFEICTFISYGLLDQYKDNVKDSLILPSLCYNDRKVSTIKAAPNKKIIKLAYLGSLFEKDYPELMYRFCELLFIHNVQFEFKIIGRFRNVAEGRKWMKIFSEANFHDRIVFIENPTNEIKNLALNQSDFVYLFRKPELLQKLTFPTRVTEMLSLNKVLLINSFGDFKLYFRDLDNALIINDINDESNILKLKVALEERKYLEILKGGNLLLNKDFDASENAKKIINKLNSMI